jgi:4-amino-4-deoxy-L-arabinose transferase-like glycosyltransferase
VARLPGSNENERKLDWRPVLIVLGIALLLRFIHFAFVLKSPISYQLSPDENYYLSFAKAVAGGGSGLTETFAFLDPLYGYIAGLVFRMFGEEVFKVYFLQILLDTFTVFCLILVGRELDRPRAGLLAGLLYGTTVTALLFTTTLLKATWVANYMTMWVLCGLVLLRRPRPWAWVLFGILCGYGIALRSSLLPMALMALLLPWFGMLQSRRSLMETLRGTGFLVAGLLLPLALLAARNYQAIGKFSPLSSNNGIVLHMHFNVENPAGTTHLPSFVSYRNPDEMQRGYTAEAERRLGRELTPREVNTYWRGEAIDYIRTHPYAAARSVFFKFTTFFAHPEIPNNRFLADEGLFSPVLKILPSPFGWLLALGVPGFVLLLFRDRRALLLFAPIATAIVTVSIIAPIGRYRFHSVPMFALGAGLFLENLCLYLGQRKIRQTTLMLVAAALLAGLSFWLGSFVRLPLPRWDKAVYGYLKMGDLEAAKKVALKAVAEQPGYYKIHEALAAVAATEKDYPTAVNHYKRALQIKPDSHVAHFECARLLSIMGKNEEALAHARAAMEISPRTAYQTLVKKLTEKRSNKIDLGE